MGLTDPRPIGVFDSGVGGLTVLRALRARFPDESMVYLGDTARVPYGTKSAEVVTRYSLRNAAFLTAQDVKLLVVAWYTAFSVALTALRATRRAPAVWRCVIAGCDQALLTYRTLRLSSFMRDVPSR